MSVRADIQVALANMRANKMRSIFSMLGIIIGGMAVIVVISVVNGARQAALEKAKAGKEDILRLIVRYQEDTGRIPKMAMAEVELVQSLPHVKSAYPVVAAGIDVRGAFGRTSTELAGADLYFFDFYGIVPVQGRLFNEEEVKSRPRICVISPKLAERLFGIDYPIGQRIRLPGSSLEVVGVFKRDERQSKVRQTASLVVPFKTALQMTHESNIYEIQVHTESGKIDQVKRSIQAVMDEGRLPRNAVSLVDSRDDLRETEKWARAWMVQMFIVASISLFVGGIGLMNVMLTTVAERTHEIGLRKALGADSRAILHQFLIESVTLSGVGGLAGVMLGVMMSQAVDVLSKGKISVAVLPASVVLSFGFSLATGILFGLLPASKAAHMSPVEALRYE
jgi:ABC-type antimicrobial peptide transport system permease subunit